MIRDGIYSRLPKRQDLEALSQRAKQNSLRECEELISRLERAADSLSSKECFELWRSLAALKYGAWRKGLSKDVVKEVDISYVGLIARLVTILRGQHSKLLPSLEDVLTEMIDKIELERQHAEVYYRQNRLGSGWTSYELDNLLLDRRDSLEYVRLLNKEMGLSLSRDFDKRLQILDDALNASLPRIFRQFRDARDDPNPHPDRFPETFWWRRLGTAPE